MNITLLMNRDLASHLALTYIRKMLKGHRFSLFLSEKVGAEQELPYALAKLTTFEHELLSDGRPSFEQIAEQLDCNLQDFADCDYQINTSKGFKKIGLCEPDLIICVRFGLILQQPIIDLPKHGVINLHSGVLPAYRGVMATFRAMLNNETEVGSTLHYINDSKIDSGAVIAVAKAPLNVSASYMLNLLSMYHVGCINIAVAVAQLSRGDQIENTVQATGGQYYTFPTDAELSDFHFRGYKLFNRSEVDAINRLYSQL
ncbi:formyltransferase family protein [Gammaproteobacteria bacterium]|nr:formyltransferase family protein [Gammaproteobacteria bacterium]